MSEQEATKTSKIQVCVLCQKEVTGEHPVCPYDGGPLVLRRPDRMLGTTIAGKYEIQEVVNRGGMGVIYRGRHLALERPVAVKCIAEVLTYDPSMWKRFEQEAKSASLLNHPNIITVHDFGVTEHGDLYLVMEYLEGASLNDFIELNGQLDERTCARLFCQVCDALHHAHGMNILHRDLKPSNIYISSTSRGAHVKVLDFGLAKAMIARDKNREKITRTGECLGTPDYMSPEQTRGIAMDQRSDIYACGVCMFEALTGKLPFSSEDLMQILSKQMIEKPPSFNEANPAKKIDPEMEKIVMRCLEKDPQKRFQSMAELQAELNNYLQNANGGSAQKKAEKPAPNSQNKNNEVDTKLQAAGPAELKQAKTDSLDFRGSSAGSERISRLTGRSARLALWGFATASILLICTATAVLMPSKNDNPVVAHTVSGVLYYFDSSQDNPNVELNVGGKTLKFSAFNNEAIKITNPDGLTNGAVWDCSYHQGANGLELDSAYFSGMVDPIVRAADALLRRHYGELGRKQWEAAYDNLDPLSSLRKSNFEEFKRGFKFSNHNPDSELAPANATKVVSVSKDSARVLVDMSYFSKGGSGYYAFSLLRKKGRWLIDSVRSINRTDWERS